MAASIGDVHREWTPSVLRTLVRPSPGRRADAEWTPDDGADQDGPVLVEGVPDGSARAGVSAKPGGN